MSGAEPQKSEFCVAAFAGDSEAADHGSSSGIAVRSHSVTTVGNLVVLDETMFHRGQISPEAFFFLGNRNVVIDVVVDETGTQTPMLVDPVTVRNSKST